MKKIHKKLLVIALSVVLLAAAPLSALMGVEIPWISEMLEKEAVAASYSGSCGTSANWSLNTSTGVLNITGSGDMTAWAHTTAVPWNSYRTNVKTVTIANTITSIGNFSFSSCKNLTSVTIGSGVKKIGDAAFSFCTSLASISIPNSVTSIGMGAFSSCSKLASISLPSSVTTLGDGAFEYCTALKTISLPDSITSIGENAFLDCGYYSTSGNWSNNVLYIGKHLIKAKKAVASSYTINANTKTIAKLAFADCNGLTSLTAPADNAYFSSDSNGVLFNKAKTVLVQYPIGNTRTSYSIPTTVTGISYGAFAYCTSKLTTITIPDSITVIGEGAFIFCNGITKVTIGNYVTKVGKEAFALCANLTEVTIGNSVTEIDKEAFFCCRFLKTVRIGNSVTKINDGAFAYDVNLSKVYYENSKANWGKITIGTLNTDLTTASFSYGSAHTHSYTATVIKEATCNEPGIKELVCSCGNRTTETIPTDGAHKLTHKTVASTCTTKGYECDYCSACGGTFNKVELPLAGHTYTSEVTTAATCTKAGVRTYTCSVCGDSYTEAIPATGTHSLTHKTVASTCKTQGYEYDYCSACQGTFNKVDLPLASHKYTSSVTTAATCAKAGVRTYTCSVCSNSYTEAIPATGKHTYTSKITTAATCTKAGVRTYTCSVCGDSYTEAIPATGEHSLTHKTVASTCKVQGYEYDYCSVCQGTFNKVDLPYASHSYKSEITVAPTCAKAGVKTYTCTVCSYSYTSVVPATGNHSLTHKTVASTCTTKGYEYDYCSVCQGTFNKVDLPLVPHVYGSKITKAPTCTEAGIKTYECVCGDSYTEAIPATGHSYQGTVCGNCGDVRGISAPENSSVVIDTEKKLISGIETGLDFDGLMNSLAASDDVTVSADKDVIGTGTVITVKDKATGEVIDEYTIVIFGDYNGDGLADSEDTTYFSAIANFEIFDYYEHEYLFMAADINGDGVVDAMDEDDMNAVANFEAYIDHTITEGSKVVRY